MKTVIKMKHYYEKILVHTGTYRQLINITVHKARKISGINIAKLLCKLALHNNAETPKNTKVS